MAYHSSIKEADRTYHIKLAIRAFNAVLSLIGIGLVAYIINYWDRYIGEIDGFNIGHRRMFKFEAWTLMSFIPFGLTVLAFGISLMYCLLRKKSIHPGWTIAYDLVATGAFIAFTYMTYYSAYRYWRLRKDACVALREHERNTYIFWDRQVKNTDETQTVVEKVPEVIMRKLAELVCEPRYRNTKLAAAIVTMMSIFPHFLLFVWGVFDTSRRRHEVVGKRMADEMLAQMETGGRREVREESVI